MSELPSKASTRLLPLVLHRLVTQGRQAWEDVELAHFEGLVRALGPAAVVLQADRPVPRSGWLITFDDGNESDHALAIPILLRHAARATFFVISDEVGRPGRLSWAQLREMQALGMVVGSHSASHRRLTQLRPHEAAEELRRSREVLEDGLGAAVTGFSYPYGECSTLLHAMARDAGYCHVYTSAHGLVRRTDRPMPRNSIHGAMDASMIDRVLHPTRALRLRWAVEDRAKTWAKSVVGRDRYLRWRNGVGSSQ